MIPRGAIRRADLIAATSRLTATRIFNAVLLQAFEMTEHVVGRYDLIHAHNFPSNIAALIATKLKREFRDVPYIWQCNESIRLIYDRTERQRVSRPAPFLRKVRALVGLVGRDVSSRVLDGLACENA